MVMAVARIAARFYDEDEPLQPRARRVGSALDAERGAASSASSPPRPDELDWDDEVRIALEERASLSPDALTGMEANLRFGPARKRWRRASSGVCRHGRTGSSSDRTRSAKPAR